MFAGIAGIAYAAQYSSSIAPGTGAQALSLTLSPVLSSAELPDRGAGSIFGTLLGVFVMSILKSGLPYIGLQSNWQQIITGLIDSPPYSSTY